MEVCKGGSSAGESPQWWTEDFVGFIVRPEAVLKVWSTSRIISHSVGSALERMRTSSTKIRWKILTKVETLIPEICLSVYLL
jgi:hypothetical protein